MTKATYTPRLYLKAGTKIYATNGDYLGVVARDIYEGYSREPEDFTLPNGEHPNNWDFVHPELIKAMEVEAWKQASKA